MEVNKIELSWNDLFEEGHDNYQEYIINVPDRIHLWTSLSFRLKGEHFVGFSVKKVWWAENGLSLDDIDVNLVKAKLRQEVKDAGIEFISKSIREASEKLVKGSHGIVSTPGQSLNIFSHG